MTTDVRKLKHTGKALPVILSDPIAESNFIFHMTKWGQELHLLRVVSVSNEGFCCCCNIKRNYNIHGLNLGILQLGITTQAGIPLHSKTKLWEKKIPDSANVTQFCWITLKLVPLCPPAFYRWEGHRAWDRNTIKPQGALKKYFILQATQFSAGNTYLIFW